MPCLVQGFLHLFLLTSHIVSIDYSKLTEVFTLKKNKTQGKDGGNVLPKNKKKKRKNEQKKKKGKKKI